MFTQVWECLGCCYWCRGTNLKLTSTSFRTRITAIPLPAQSKLAMQMITAELAQRQAGKKPTVNCLDPGAPSWNHPGHMLAS